MRRGEQEMQAVRLINTANMDRDEWREWRRKGIGGSDIAAIAGLNPWKSPIAVYFDKLNEIPQADEDNEAMHFGRILEDVVADEFARRNGHNGRQVQRVNAVLQHPSYPQILANIDRVVYDKDRGNAVLEIKTTSEWNRSNWDDDQLPDMVMCQVQHYLGVTGLGRAYVACLIGGNKYVQHEIQRDDEIIDHLQQIALEFWQRVENRTPPEMDGSKASSDLLKQLYPKSNGETVRLPMEAEELVDRIEQCKDQEKALEQERKEAENKLKAMLEDNEAGIAGEREVRWKPITSCRFDSTSFRKDHPDLYDQYAKESSYRRFDIK